MSNAETLVTSPRPTASNAENAAMPVLPASPAASQFDSASPSTALQSAPAPPLSAAAIAAAAAAAKLKAQMEERAAAKAAKEAEKEAARKAKEEEKAAAKAAKEAEKAAAKAAKEEAAAAAKAAKEAERAAAKAAKEAEPKRPVGRPRKTPDASASVVSSVSANDGVPLPRLEEAAAAAPAPDGRLAELEAEVAELRTRLAAEVTAKQALLARIAAASAALAS